MSKSNKKINKAKKFLFGIIIPLIIPILFFILWEIAANNGWINTRFYSSPSRIWKEFKKLYESGALVESLIVSGRRVFTGFFYGAVAGLVLGVLTGLFSLFERSLSAIVGALRPIPMVAWLPVFLIWFGIDETPKIVIIAVGSFWPILVNTAQGIKNVDIKYLEVGRMLEKNKIEILSKIVLPASLPSIFTGIRLGISSAWNCVVTAEMIAASAGVGHMIMQGRQYNNIKQVFVGILIIGVFGLILDELLLFLEGIFLKWNSSDK